MGLSQRELDQAQRELAALPPPPKVVTLPPVRHEKPPRVRTWSTKSRVIGEDAIREDRKRLDKRDRDIVVGALTALNRLGL